MARKAWEDLSPDYRKRLERAGITKEQHSAGKPLAKARGHWKDVVRRWAKRHAKMYGRDPADDRIYLADVPTREDMPSRIERELMKMDEGEARELMSKQDAAERMYHRGDIEDARLIWEQREHDWPEWMFFYHGYFS